MQRNLLKIIVFIFSFSFLITIALLSNIIIGNYEVVPHGAVASDVQICSKYGVEALREGNAMDAAITTVFCIGVINNAHSGIGGGGFMLIHVSQEKKTIAINFRETMPNSDKDAFLNEASSIGIPGELLGLYKAHKKYGSLSWPKLLNPAINLALNGFPITQATEKALNKKFKDPMELITRYPLLAEIYVKYVSLINVTSSSLATQKRVARFVTAGDVTRNPRLAKTLKLIAEKGPHVFYNGEIGKNIVDEVKRNNGFMTMDDLRHYTVEDNLTPYHFSMPSKRLLLNTPSSSSNVRENFAEYEILTFPLPSSGPVLALETQILLELGINNLIIPFRQSPENEKIAYHHSNLRFMMERLRNSSKNNFFKANVNSPLDIKGQPLKITEEKQLFATLPAKYTSLYYHWLIEAMKVARLYKLSLKDVSGDSSDETLLPGIKIPYDPKGLANQILNETAFNISQYEAIIPDQDKEGTAHVSVIDGKDMIVSVTSTLNNLFGSKIMTQDGILLNDELKDFENPKTNIFNSPNIPRAGRRPISSMIPTIALQKNMPCGLKLALGGSNGSRIISGIAQVMNNVLLFGDDLGTAMNRPRLYVDIKKDIVEVEGDMPDWLIQDLQARNHNIVKVSEGLNSVLSVMKMNDVIWATSDPRKSQIQSAAIL